MPIKIENIRSDEVKNQFFFLRKDYQDFNLEVIDRATWQKKKGESSASGDIYNLGKIVRVFNASQVTCKDPEALEALKTSLSEKVRKHNFHPIQLLKFLFIPWILAKIFHWDSLLFYDHLKPLSVKKEEALTNLTPIPDTSQEELKLAHLEKLAEFLNLPSEGMENLTKEAKILALEADLSQIKSVVKGDISQDLDLSPLKGLENLSLQSDQMPVSIGELSSLKTLSIIKACRFDAFSFSCHKLQNLKTLTLSRVPLGRIPEEIYSLGALTTLNIQNSSLRFGKEDAEKLLKMKSLTHLDFRGSLFGKTNEGIQYLLANGWKMNLENGSKGLGLHKPIDTSAIEKRQSIFPLLGSNLLGVEKEILSSLTPKERGVLSQVSRQAYSNVNESRQKAYESIKSDAIGPRSWIQWGYDELDEESIEKAVRTLPLNIQAILGAPDPLDPQKKIGETHLLLCDFEFSLERLWFFIQTSIPGLSNISAARMRPFSLLDSSLWKERAALPQWVLIRKELLSGSLGKSFGEQEALVKKLASDSKLPYRMPKARHALEANLGNFFKNGTFLFGQDQYTYVQDKLASSSLDELRVGSELYYDVLIPVCQTRAPASKDMVGTTAVFELS